MKQLTCEMCGSTDLIKQDGVFVCQTCGTKYSLEDAKKMMIEGTVEIQGTVKVDDTAKIQNYYTMATSAYASGNQREAESYCNRIIEIDPLNYKAWFLKGKVAGWQSTIRNVRLEESMNCFIQAINNAPENEVKKIKKEAASEMSSLSIALMKVCCDNFADYPSKESIDDIVNNSQMVEVYALRLLSECGIMPNEFHSEKAILMNNAACEAWKNKITKDYKHEEHPSKYEWETFEKRCIWCIGLLDLAIINDGSNDQANIVRYKNQIEMATALLNSCSYKYSNGGYSREWSLNKEGQKMWIDKIMEYHEKIKKLDPSYEIPKPPQSPKSGGCYVATAVYGSYDCPQVWTLRRFRDYTLAETWYGRAFIYTYYAISPTLINWFGETTWFKKMWKSTLDRLVAKLQAKGVESTPYEDRRW